MNVNQKPAIKTGNNIVLRQLTTGDEEDISRHANNANIANLTANIPYPYTVEDASAWISKCKAGLQTGSQYTFGMELNKEVIGAVGLKVNTRNNHAEVGYWVGETYWNRGFCTSALQAIIEYGFSYLNLHKIIGTHLPHNEASGRVMRKCGFILEATFKEHVYKQGKYYDLLQLYILKYMYEQLGRGKECMIGKNE